MLYRLSSAAALGLLLASPALAGDRLNPHERNEIRQVLAEVGCHGGDIDKERSHARRYEIDDVKCEDGKEYEVYMDAHFRVRKTKPD